MVGRDAFYRSDRIEVEAHHALPDTGRFLELIYKWHRLVVNGYLFGVKYIYQPEALHISETDGMISRLALYVHFQSVVVYYQKRSAANPVV